jgi:hypothetical protein
MNLVFGFIHAIYRRKILSPPAFAKIFALPVRLETMERVLRPTKS